MCLDKVGLLIGFGFLLGFSELLDQAHGSALEATVESASGAGVEDVEKFVGGDVEKSEGTVSAVPATGNGDCDILVKVDSSVGELSEGSSLLDLGSLLGVVLSVGHDCDLCG